MDKPDLESQLAAKQVAAAFADLVGLEREEGERMGVYGSNIIMGSDEGLDVVGVRKRCAHPSQLGLPVR